MELLRVLNCTLLLQVLPIQTIYQYNIKVHKTKAMFKNIICTKLKNLYHFNIFQNK